MSREGFPVIEDGVQQEPAPDYDHFLNTYGLGPDEVNAEAVFGNHRGTMGGMLSDERCPVGGMMAQAYQAEGLAGVEKQMGLLHAMSPDFTVAISEQTREYHAGTTSREDLVSQQPERPDFLAR